MSFYQERIGKVLSYVERHLHEKQDLEKLAEKAFLSKFHFHRIMTSYLGEPLATYVNRLRLEKAGTLLKYSQQSIEQVAYAVGYESPTSFTRSFKKAFSVAPAEYRKQNAGTFTMPTVKEAPAAFSMIPEVKTIPPFMVLAYQVRGKVGSDNTLEAWEKLRTFAQKNNIIQPGTKFIAVHWSDPTVTAEDNIRYDACITLTNPFENSGPFLFKRFPGGKYLCVSYKGDFTFLPGVYNQVFREYVFKQPFVLREEPVFEQFLASRNSTRGKEVSLLIHIPVE